MAKDDIRRQVRSMLQVMSDLKRDQASHAMVTHAISLLSHVDSIAVYRATKSEICLNYLIDYALGIKKNIYQPIAYNSTKIMRFSRYNKQNEHIFYPDNYALEDELKWHELDLIFVPLLAVDMNGNRLGKGGGYYDATLEKIKTLKIRPLLCGVGFAQQMLDFILPADRWDIQLDYFISENEFVRFK